MSGQQVSFRLSDIQGAEDVTFQPGDVQADARAPVQAPQMPATGSAGSARGQVALDVLKGGLKGAGQSAVGLGRWARRLTPFTEAIPEGAESALGLDPTTGGQSAGMAIERLLEFLLPGGAPAKAAKLLAAKAGLKAAPVALSAAMEAIPAAVMTGAQGGNPVIGGALGAAGPVVGAGISKAAKALKQSSLGNIEKALNPTRHRTKAKATRIASEIQKRGITGKIEDVRDLAKEQRGAIGEDIDDALRTSASVEINLKPVRDALDKVEATTHNLVKPADDGSIVTLKDGQKVQVGGTNPDGSIKGTMVTMKRVVHDPRKQVQVDKVRAILDEYGDTMTTEQAVALRRTWDDTVARAGGFDEKAGNQFGVTLDDATEAGVKRPIAGALRKELASAHPDVAALNKEFKFWADLDDVSSATQTRRVGQKRNLTRTIMRGAVMGGGMASGGSITGSILAGEAAARAETLFASPKWNLVSAKVKNQLAEALMSRNPERVGSALGRASAALAAQR